MASRLTKKRRWPWLVAAALLFGLGAWVMSGTEEENETKAKKVHLPRFMTRDERERNQGRQTLPVLPTPAVAEGAPLLPPQVRDPVLAAMPTSVKNGAVVIEANAIRHSELGNLMIECVFAGKDESVLAGLKDAGFDPVDKLDRVAVADSTLILTGDFSGTDVGELINADTRRQFGPNAELFSRSRSDGGVGQPMALWKGQVLVTGDSEEEVTTVLDRLDGKGDPTEKRVLTDEDAYGEMYGIIKPGPLAAALSEENPALAALLDSAASTIKIHADVSHDVGLVADIQGSDPTKTQDLRKALGSALTLAKLQAEAKGNKSAAEVLGFARVSQAKGGFADFHLEAGIPHEFLEKQLRKCIADKKQRVDAGR